MKKSLWQKITWYTIWKRWFNHLYGKDGQAFIEDMLQKNIFGERFAIIPYSLDNEREEKEFDMTRIYASDEVTQFERDNCVIIEYEGSGRTKIVTFNGEEYPNRYLEEE